ncbi:MAG: hypothetical protein ACOX6G_09675 [Christensenellales bacterium]|nr:hypothetical protein [Clostridiales bacterium]
MNSPQSRTISKHGKISEAIKRAKLYKINHHKKEQPSKLPTLKKAHGNKGNT